MKGLGKQEYTKTKEDAKFNAYVPTGVNRGKPAEKKQYDPRDFLDNAARKRVQDLIKASREAT